jgi:hypothetical protein
MPVVTRQGARSNQGSKPAVAKHRCVLRRPHILQHPVQLVVGLKLMEKCSAICLLQCSGSRA